MIAAVYWDRQSCQLLGGTCLAAAALIKVFPAALLVYFVWRRRWRFVAGALGSLIVGGLLLPGLIFGWNRNAMYLKQWTKEVALASVNTGTRGDRKDIEDELLGWEKSRNQSLTAVLSRLTGWKRAEFLAWGVGVGMFAVMTVLGWHYQTERELYFVSAYLVWLLLITPVSETHYFIVLLLPLMALVAAARSHPDAVARHMATLALVYFGVAAYSMEVVPGMKKVGSLCWGSLAVWAALLFVAKRRKNQPFEGA